MRPTSRFAHTSQSDVLLVERALKRELEGVVEAALSRLGRHCAAGRS